MALLVKVQQAIATASAGEERDEAESALAELREVVEQDKPDAGEVVRRTGRLRKAVGKLGVAAATAATTHAAETLAEMAINGQFF